MSTRIIGKKRCTCEHEDQVYHDQFVVMNKRSTTKDSGRNREGIIFLIDHGASFRVVELVWEDLVQGVELGSLLLDVDYMVGEKQLHF
jgi:hypothetical protein